MRRPATGHVGRHSSFTRRALGRRGFILGCASAAALPASWPRAARATGGLDVSDGENEHQVRVLLATGAYAAPLQTDAWRFAWDGRTYRGVFAETRLPGGGNGLLNVLPLDAYLYGVLSREVLPGWTAAAQRAQAIVSRTYLLLKLRPERPYDVTASDADQNYGGIESESVEGRAAVDATAATIVTFDARPARVAYSACCGGRTADAGDVWNTPYPYLTSVVDPNCAAAAGFAWQTAIPLPILEAALRNQMAACGRLNAVELRGVTGARPRAIAFVGDASTSETPLQRFRNAVGARVVPSTFVREAALARDGASLALAGTGRGHGVGLCQWGARGLGESGASAEQIVAFYFPGTSLGRA